MFVIGVVLDFIVIVGDMNVKLVVLGKSYVGYILLDNFIGVVNNFDYIMVILLLYIVFNFFEDYSIVIVSIYDIFCVWMNWWLIMFCGIDISSFLLVVELLSDLNLEILVGGERLNILDSMFF